MYGEVEVYFRYAWTWYYKESGEFHVPAALPRREYRPWYPSDRRLCGTKSRSRRCEEKFVHAGNRTLANYYTDLNINIGYLNSASMLRYTYISNLIKIVSKSSHLKDFFNIKQFKICFRILLFFCLFMCVCVCVFPNGDISLKNMHCLRTE